MAKNKICVFEKGRYIGNNVFLHRNYIGDSVLDNDVMFGAQAVTGNLRFNGEKIFSVFSEEKIDTNMNKLGAIVGNLSKIGVNATILPGIKIGKETWVGPGETVKYDIEDKTYLSDGKEKENIKAWYRIFSTATPQRGPLAIVSKIDICAFLNYYDS